MILVSDYDRAHVGEVLGDTKRYTHWTAKFWRLYHVSDPEHRAALANAAPEHASVYEAWERSPDPS